MDNPKKLILIDAHAFSYRAFYAIRELSTSYGQPTNAVFGFVNIIRKILDKWHPEYAGICFDVSRDTFRQKKFKEYKMQRKPMPDSLRSQMPIIQEIVAAYNLAIIEKQGFEADDIIATLAKKAAGAGIKVIIVSTDKDILQLVDESIAVFNPYKEDGLLYTRKEILGRFGVEASLIPDIISLMGDDADNIPGTAGIGEKTATALVRDFKSLDGLLSNLDKIKQDKVKNSISENLEQIKLNRELTALDDNVSLDISLDDLRVVEPDYEKLFKIFHKLEFKSLLNALPNAAGKGEKIEAILISDKDSGRLTESVDKHKRIGIILSSDKRNIFLATNKSLVFVIGVSNKEVSDILQDKKAGKITYNLKYLVGECAKNKIDISEDIFDVMLAAYLIDPGKASYELKDISVEFLERPIDFSDSAEAAAALLELEYKLKKILEERDLLNLFYNVEIPLSSVLAQMELSGVSLDLKFLKNLSMDLEKRLSGLVKQIYKLSDIEFNINSPKQLREILFVRLKLPIMKKTKTGPSTDEEVLRALASKHDLPKLLLDYRMMTKLKSTYIDALPELVNDKTHRIHAFFNQTGTQTGRIACQNPNLQNIPIKTELGSQVRKAFICSDKSHYLISSDYSQIELRILAHLSGDEKLKKAFDNDEDIHKFTASLIYGLEEADITDAMRDVAKRVNFGIIYGITSFGLARDLGITNDQAQEFIDTYFARYPKVKDYMQEQICFAQENGFVATLLGRRRYLPDINSKNTHLQQFSYRQAINTPIQGSAADLIKLAMVQIHKDTEQEKFSLVMLLQIHDELLFEVKKKDVKEAVGFIRERMEHVHKISVPIKVDVKIGENWLEMEEAK